MIERGRLTAMGIVILSTVAPHSSTLAWKIPWTEERGGLQSMGSLRVGHDWVTSLSLFTFIIGEGNGSPLQCSCLENPGDGGAVYGVAQSWTRLKRLGSSHLITGPNVKWYTPLEKSLDISHEIRHTLNTWTRYSTVDFYTREMKRYAYRKIIYEYFM